MRIAGFRPCHNCIDVQSDLLGGHRAEQAATIVETRDDLNHCSVEGIFVAEGKSASL